MEVKRRKLAELGDQEPQGEVQELITARNYQSTVALELWSGPRTVGHQCQDDDGEYDLRNAQGKDECLRHIESHCDFSLQNIFSVGTCRTSIGMMLEGSRSCSRSFPN